jgi:ferritin-like metal-binding protein YciE
MNMVEPKDRIVAWLKDAYAMEESIVEVLDKQVAMTADLPEIQQGIQRHLEATKMHAETVKGCLESLGEETSGLKAGMAKVGGKVQGLMMGMAPDSLVKNALQDYATEHMEIASYRALIVAAQQTGLTEIETACTSILHNEEAMAAWLEQQLPTIVQLELSSAN